MKKFRTVTELTIGLRLYVHPRKDVEFVYLGEGKIGTDSELVSPISEVSKGK